MAIFDIFSVRKGRLARTENDVYQYDVLPDPLRVQIIHIWRDALGDGDEYWQENYYGTKSGYQAIVDILCREYGVFQLYRTKTAERHYLAELCEFFLHESSIDKCIDVVETSFLVIDKLTRDYQHLKRHNAGAIADKAIVELNHRLLQHRVGYHYADGKMIRIDTELIHQEITRPALALLNQEHLRGAQQEFLHAHEHYREGRAKEALSNALKSFESTMKAICERRGWACATDATSSRLIECIFSNGLVPPYWQSQMSAVRSLLESGVPTARNRLGGHGQGTVPTTVPDHLVAYVLHMTAAAIVFLAEADQALN